MQPAIDAVEECVEILASKLYNGGKIQDKCEHAGFYERLTLIERQFPGAAVMLHKMGYLPEGFRQLWSNERLLNVVEQLVGPDIAGTKNSKNQYNRSALQSPIIITSEGS